MVCWRYLGREDGRNAGGFAAACSGRSFRHTTTAKHRPNDPLTGGTMLKVDHIRVVLCALAGGIGLLLAGCTHDPITPAPVQMMGVYRTSNSVSPVVPFPAAAPPAAAASASHISSGMPVPAARQPLTAQRASRTSGVTGKRSASTKVHGPHPSRMTSAASGRIKIRRVHGSSAAALTRSNPESIPLDQPVTTSTSPVWVPSASAEASQPQFRPPAP